MTHHHVNMDGRHFIVCLDEKGEPLNVKERVIYAEGKPWQAFMNVPRWHHNHNPIPKKTDALYRRVIDEARNDRP